MPRSGVMLMLGWLLPVLVAAADPALLFSVRFTAESEFQTGSGTAVYRETLYELNPEPARPLGYRHQYRVFDLPRKPAGPAALTNGHLHATGPLIHLESLRARITLHPLVAVSSNVLRDQRDFQADDFHLHGRIAWGPGASGQRGGAGGLISDNRWGRRLVYPFAGWQTHPENPASLLIGFPDSSARWAPAPAWVLRADAGPSGGVWRTRNADFSQTGTFRQQGLAVSATLRYQAASSFSLALGLEREFSRRWDVPLEEGGIHRLEPPNDTRGTLTLAFHF